MEIRFIFLKTGGLETKYFHLPANKFLKACPITLGPAYDRPVFILPEFVSYLEERGVLYVGNGAHFCTPVLMNMCNITFEVPRLNTFIFNVFRKKILTIIFVVRSLKAFGWNNVEPDGGPTLFQTCANVSCYPGDKVSRTRMAVRANTGQSPNSVSMLGQRRIRLTGIEPSMGCDAGPTLDRYWVGRSTLCVPGTSDRPVH